MKVEYCSYSEKLPSKNSNHVMFNQKAWNESHEIGVVKHYNELLFWHTEVMTQVAIKMKQI